MRNTKALFLFVVLLSVCGTSAFAQTKKKLKTQIEELTVENQQLKKNTDILQKRNKAILDEKASLETEVKRLQNDYVSLKSENDDLRKQIELSKKLSENSSATAIAEANVNRPCSKKEAQLNPGTSYFESLNPLKHGGWGVQVYSFATLCQALDKAEKFRASYKLYNTYVRVKEIGGKKVYSVVYGSLKDYEQAKVYCSNFRKIAKDEAGKNAFLVQH